jgi:RNA polymerase sigma-70 factor, ECF subfamily
VPFASQSRVRDDRALVEALRRGDERAFAEIVDEHSSSLLRVAMIYVGSRAVAEEVVQETWLGVLGGIDRFEGRSSFKTWLFKILTNTARTRGVRERRTVPFSAFAEAGREGEGPVVDADRFFPPDHDRYPDHWALGPVRWQTPEEGLVGGETRAVIDETIAELPASQRTVITLRDIEGWPSEEVCEALAISEGNQRVLLHRARAKVRTALEAYFGAVEETMPA